MNSPTLIVPSTMKPRILFGGLFHETHTFLSEPTRWSDFGVTLGADIMAKEGDESPTAGFLEEARRFGWEVVPYQPKHRLRLEEVWLEPLFPEE